MAEYLIQDTTLTAIADAIRSKTGTTEPMPVTDMANQITSITTGGGGDYTVTFMNYNGTAVLYEKQVMEHDTCAEPVSLGLIDTPTKESTAQFTYTFEGWYSTANHTGPTGDDDILKNITSDITIYAVMVATIRHYMVSFYDGDTLLKQIHYEYGTTPSYTPEKEGYTFVGWDKTPVPVTGDASYYAVWESGFSFASATWEEINTICEAGEAANYFSVGDEKQISNGTYAYTLRIIGMNLTPKTDGSGKAGITVMALPLTDKGEFNVSGRQSYWNSSSGTMFKWLRDSFANRLPAEVTQYVKQVDIKTANYTEGSAASYTDKIYYFTPSVYEVGSSGTGSMSSHDSGIKYPGLSTSALRTLTDSNGEAVTWWLRTPYSNKAYYVTATGGIANRANNASLYICPCFCI